SRRVVEAADERRAVLEVDAIADDQRIAGAELRTVVGDREHVGAVVFAAEHRTLDALAFEHAQVDRLRAQFAVRPLFVALLAGEQAQQALFEGELHAMRSRRTDWRWIMAAGLAGSSAHVHRRSSMPGRAVSRRAG